MRLTGTRLCGTPAGRWAAQWRSESTCRTAGACWRPAPSGASTSTALSCCQRLCWYVVVVGAPCTDKCTSHSKPAAVLNWNIRSEYLHVSGALWLLSRVLVTCAGASVWCTMRCVLHSCGLRQRLGLAHFTDAPTQRNICKQNDGSPARAP